MQSAIFFTVQSCVGAYFDGVSTGYYTLVALCKGKGRGRGRAKGKRKVRANAGQRQGRAYVKICKIVPALLCESFPSAWSGNCVMCQAAPQKQHLGLARGPPATQPASQLTKVNIQNAHFLKGQLKCVRYETTLRSQTELLYRVEFRLM